jgi:hypothetical protein
MLLGLSGGLEMIEHISAWLHDPINLDILRLLGGFGTTIVGGLWAFFTWLLAWRQARTLDELKKVTADAIAKAQTQAPPISQESTERPLPSPPPPALDKSRRHTGLSRVSLVIALLVTLAGGIYGLVGYREVSDTVTSQLRVCTGEYENSCGFPHDAYLYCYSDVGRWAQGRCLKYSVTVLGSHDGNKCGYTNYSVLCAQKKP